MFELPKLPYEYNALEPHVDEGTMKIHHDKHHQAYLNKLNTALETHPEFFEKSIEEILSNLEAVPEEIRGAVKNHGGGYYHHSLFWEIMSPNSSCTPSGDLATAINDTFESFESFQEQFKNSALALFGAGWTWLVKNKSGDLLVVNTSNQDSPISKGYQPILGIDVWEHAYYLKY